MSQISIIKKSDIQEARRFDAEFFKPEYLEIERKLEKINNNLLDNLIIKLTDYHANGSYQILKEHVKLLDKPDYALMIRTVDFETDNFENNVKYISENAYNFLNKTKLYGGEIIINKIGNAGRVYFMPYLNRKVSLGMNQFMMRANDKINNYFLYIFLISKFGKKIIERRISGAVPLSINKQSVKNIKIPIFPQSFQLQIEKIVKSAYQKQTRSKQLYKEAKEALLKEVDLLDYKPENVLSFETTKKEIDEARRFDAEYFQPKYEKIIKKIENYKNGWDYVKNIVNWKKGVEVGSEAYQQNGMSFGRVADCSINGVADTGKKISKGLYKELKKDYQPKRDDILFTKDGTIGLSYVVKEEFDLILSGAFLRLSLKGKYQTFEKECLSLIFNSIISKMQVEKLSGGAIIAHLKPSDFEKFKIPLIKPKIQKQIAKKIQESHKLRKESKELLEEAKQKVENEIEKF